MPLAVRDMSLHGRKNDRTCEVFHSIHPIHERYPYEGRRLPRVTPIIDSNTLGHFLSHRSTERWKLHEVVESSISTLCTLNCSADVKDYGTITDGMMRDDDGSEGWDSHVLEDSFLLMHFRFCALALTLTLTPTMGAMS